MPYAEYVDSCIPKWFSVVCKWKSFTYIYRVIQKVVHKLKEFIEGLKCNNFRIETRGLGSNPDSEQDCKCYKVHEGQHTIIICSEILGTQYSRFHVKVTI